MINQVCFLLCGFSLFKSCSAGDGSEKFEYPKQHREVPWDNVTEGAGKAAAERLQAAPDGDELCCLRSSLLNYGLTLTWVACNRETSFAFVNVIN